jgi:phospholipid/cholesterol/gamma-HCH transport system substrate-binding protein
VIGNRRIATAVLLVGLIVGSAAFIVREEFLRPTRITAYFTSATGIYAGDEVRVSGVRVGTVKSVDPMPNQAKLTLDIDSDVPIPAEAKAVIVSQNLVAARYVQLTPAYRRSGPTMRDGALIPADRTAVPVEWDEVVSQLTRLATDLGPNGMVSSTSVSRIIESGANALDGNGEKLRQTLTQLSGIGRILARGSGNIVDIIKNLQNFVTTLRDSKDQIVQFQNRLATLSSVINDSRSDLDAALTNLSVAVGEVQRFVAGSRNKTAEQLQRLTNVTQNLVDHRMDLENILHGAPTAFSNGYNIYNPNIPGAIGSFIINNLSNPVAFLCSAIGAVENATAPETGKLCAQYLGPGLRQLNLNYEPIPFNPVLQRSATPDKVLYAEPRLAPGGEGPSPSAPDIPPAISAYTGLRQPPPKTLQDMLLPVEGPPRDQQPAQPQEGQGAPPP